MGIRLPKIEELSRDEQIEILNLPLDRTYLITGGPGSGKTILALYRALQLKEAYKDLSITFLVYNRTLFKYLKKAIDELGLNEISEVKTWHSWFYGFYREATGLSAPEIKKFCPDWVKILNNRSIFKNSYFDHLIIDEAQDFPAPLLDILSSMSENATIFADDHQKINDSTYKYSNNAAKVLEIQRLFRAEDKRYHLSRNYRNTEEIYKVGRLFYTGDPKDTLPKLYRRGEKPRLIKADFDDITDFIANYADNNPGQNIGVFLPAGKHCRKNIIKYYNTLKEKCDEASVQFYLSNQGRYWNKNEHKDEFDFEEDGIKIMTFLSAKGLEFETVFIPMIDDEIFDISSDTLMNQVYVCSTRAKESLIFSYENERSKSFVIRTLKENAELIENGEL